MRLIGIAGMVRGGKDTVADLLIAQGYFGFSFGDYTRERAFQRHKDKPDPISVENMTETSNWMREESGPDVILKAALEEYEKQKETHDYKGIVLYSVRAPIEVDFILERGGDIVWVEASAETRYQRGLKHIREGEAVVSLEEFMEQEAKQWLPQESISEESQMNLSYVKEKATIVINNDQDGLDVFEREVQSKLADYLQ